MKMLIGADYSLFCDSISYIAVVKAINNEAKTEEFVVLAVLKGNQSELSFNNPCILRLNRKTFNTMEKAIAFKSLITRFLNESDSVYLDEVEDLTRNRYNENKEGGNHENIIR